MTRVNRVLNYLSEHTSAGDAMDRADILNDLAGELNRKRLAYEDAISWVLAYYSGIKQDDMGRIYMAVEK